MNVAYRSYPIPKEIEFTNRYHGNSSGLDKTGEGTGKIESSRPSRRRDSIRGNHSKHSSAHLRKSSPTIGFHQNRRPESLRSVSSVACAATQKFVEIMSKDILLDYTDESYDSHSSQCVLVPDDDNELSLSELAGLLSEKLGDAFEIGLFSFDD